MKTKHLCCAMALIGSLAMTEIYAQTNDCGLQREDL